MENRKHLSLEEILELEAPFDIFELYAYLGVSRHLGGLKSTKELIELCHVDKDKYVLDIGCGVGITPCYIAKRYDAKVVGVDISEGMIDRSNERARREGVEDRVEFMAADAQDLPFEDDLFDAVIGESITTFLEYKQRAVREYVRVTKPEGYIGLNEETWIKAPPPAELVEYVSHTIGAKAEIPTSNGWEELLESSGLRDIVIRTYKINALSEFVNEIRRSGFKDLSRMLYRTLSLYIVSSAYKRHVKETWPPPKNIYEYLGYGIYVGRR